MKIYSGDNATYVINNENLYKFSKGYSVSIQTGKIEGKEVTWGEPHSLNLKNDKEVKVYLVSKQTEFDYFQVGEVFDIRGADQVLHWPNAFLKWENGCLVSKREVEAEVELAPLPSRVGIYRTERSVYYVEHETQKGCQVSLIDGKLEVQYFQLDGNRISWSRYESLQILPERVWLERGRSKLLVQSIKKGKGYSGGHNTAEKMGWSTYHAEPEKDCTFYWNGADEGAFTGYQPYTVSLSRLVV